MFASVFKRYRTWRADSMVDDELLDEIMPRIDKPAALRSSLGLGWVHVLAEERQGLAYVGSGSAAPGRRRHGLGVMTHGTRFLEFGLADAAFVAPGGK